MEEKDYFVKIVEKFKSDKRYADLIKILEKEEPFTASLFNILLPIREALNDLDKRLRKLEEARK